MTRYDLVAAVQDKAGMGDRYGGQRGARLTSPVILGACPSQGCNGMLHAGHAAAAGICMPACWVALGNFQVLHAHAQMSQPKTLETARRTDRRAVSGGYGNRGGGGFGGRGGGALAHA